MRRCSYIAVLILLLNGIKSETTTYNDSSTNDEELLKNFDPNSTITPRKIRFEEDPQLAEDYSTFEEQSGQPLRFEEGTSSSGRVTFQDDNRIEEEDNNGIQSGEREREPTRVTFQDDQPNPGIKKKRRRRRRKPRYQVPPGQYPGPVPLAPGQYPGPVQYPGAVPLAPGSGRPVPVGPEYQGYPGQLYPGSQGIGPGGRPIGQYYRPPRRPKQSFASEALSRVAGALTSIALYDDYQCVPRLLCEAAGGAAPGTSPVLQSIAGLQPLLTLLSAYNGISTSPLFVFGRAVFLGMTSKGNPGSCRYGYPQCPTDPEQLVHYLNNHNGGFFRFFNSPQPQIPQNVEQFYNQLGQYGFQQNYGPDLQSSQGPNQYQPNVPQNFNSQSVPHNPEQQYGLYQPNPQNFGPNQQNVKPSGENYGFYGPGPYQQPNYQNPQQYGLYKPYLGPQNPNSYANQYNYGYQNYGSNPYGSKYSVKNIRYKDSGKDSKIEKRIQNKPTYLYVDSDVGNVDVDSKWIFPENSVSASTPTEVNQVNSFEKNIRGGKRLKFPDEENAKTNYYDNVDGNTKGTSILFPDSQSTKYVNYYEYPPVYNHGFQTVGASIKVGNNYDFNKHYGYNNNDANENRFGNSNVYTNNNRFNYRKMLNFNENNNSYSKYMYNNEDDDGVQTVYVVRGNGDPNHPEIIKVRPGEKVML